MCHFEEIREVDALPNIKSAKKRVQISAVRAARNRAGKSALKTSIKKYNAALATGDKEAASAAYREAVKKVDQAVSHGVLHKNAAAHKKSQLTKAFNQLNA